MKKKKKKNPLPDSLLISLCSSAVVADDILLNVAVERTAAAP